MINIKAIFGKLVNGGRNGKKEREYYYKILKRAFRYDVLCVNNNFENTKNSDVPWIQVAREIGFRGNLWYEI